MKICTLLALGLALTKAHHSIVFYWSNGRLKFIVLIPILLLLMNSKQFTDPRTYIRLGTFILTGAPHTFS